MLLFTAPLHLLRKTKAFQALLGSRLNNPKLYELGYSHRVALRPFTHASIRWRKKQLEPGINKLITRIVIELDNQKDSGWFFDVGANVGLYTWEVRKVCPTRNILAFEPDPKNIKLLEKTLSEAKLQNLEIFKCALSNQLAEVSFFQDNLTSATGCVAGKDKPWIEQYLNGSANEIRVKTETLDSVVSEDKNPSLIKIDVEGHEIEVLQGGRNTLSEAKPLMIIESFPPKQSSVLSLLDELGYHSMDADRHASINLKTTNLFAWHPQGPLNKATIQKLIN
ncbi:FkbM family methyltransferase [Opitutales bacterium]|nr:FkbM family methyltransferase [Opitutales bacterium]